MSYVMPHGLFYVQRFEARDFVHICGIVVKPRLGFPMSYVMVFFIFNDLRREVIVRYVDICGIVDHQCLNFLFTIQLVQIHYQIVSELVLIYRHMTLVHQLFLGI